MNKNNLIQFAQSLIILPFVAGTVPLANVPKVSVADETIHSVYIQKINSKSDGLLAISQVIDPKVKVLKTEADAIDNYFKSHDMPLAGQGMKMAEEADKNGLDWRLIPAIAARESTGGREDCVRAKNNPFGWGSCRVSFDSLDDAIETVAMNLGGNNPSTKKHYDNKNTVEILHAYNPPSVVPHYAEQVIRIMNTIGDENLLTNVS